MATSIQITTSHNKQQEQEQTAAVGSSGSGHHRRPTPTLEINTDTSKTNSFFHTSSETPRPPPSISRKISIRQSVPPSSPTSSIPTLKEDDLYHHDSYANRLRQLVARQASQAPAPSPIPQHLYATESSLPSPTTPDLQTDTLNSLPTPLPNSNTTKHFVFPPPAAIGATHIKQDIPVLSCFTGTPTTAIPTLSEQPNLGDQPNTIPLIPSQIAESIDIVGSNIGGFHIVKLLGVGAFSRVYLASSSQGKLVAIKTIQKGKLLDDPRVRSSIEREVGILNFIDHLNIVRLEATMETEQMMCIVLEYVEGGELFDFVQKMHHQLNLTNTSVDEVQVKTLFLQLLNAVKYLHEHNIVHRDLKLENILIHKQSDQEILKITDFGLARVVDPESPLLVTRCGSEEYAAPEIVQQQDYDGRKTDIWALGIILYSLLVGYLPFRYDRRKGERVSQLFYRIVRAEVKWPQDCIISTEAKLVVQAILERDPAKRISLNDIHKLAWFH
ncbi:kinase-like domain-containing protein [Parasitella parasitica]|nr:kinase-like domain-containing protein [Parasitella parasitica]